MNKVTNEFKTMPEDGFSVVSPEELVHCEGGLFPLIFGVVVGAVSIATGAVVTVFTFGKGG